MVQQLSLYGVFADAEREIVVKTLEAASGMASRRLETDIQIWEPEFPFRPRMTAGQVNQIEQYRIFLHNSTEIVVQEVPEPGKNIKVISQSVWKANIDQGSPDAFLKGLGYTFRSKYSIQGFEFILPNRLLTIHLFQIYNDDGLVDDSRQWILKVFVEVQSVTDLPAVDQATSELEAFQQDYKGLFTLTMPNRGSFNSRVRRVM